MYKNEFETKHLNNLSKSILFYGNNLYLVHKYIEIYKNKIKSNNILKQYFQDYDYFISMKYLSQNSLFGGDNLLIIYTDAKIKKKELDQLVKISYNNKNSYFIYIFTGEDRNAKTLQNSFLVKYSSIWVRLFRLNIEDNIEELKNLSQKLNLLISDENINLLYRTTNNIFISSSELNKLSILNREIKQNDIHNLIFSINNLELEDFSIHLLDSKNNIFIELKTILENGETEASIIRYLSYFFNKITLFLTYKTIFYHINFKEILGYQPPINIVNKYNKLINKISITQLELISNEIMKTSILIYEKSNSEINIYIFRLLIFIKKYDF